MSDNNDFAGTIIGVKRVRRATDTKGREKVVLTFGLDKDGNNIADVLMQTLTALQGKQVNFDIRLDKRTSEQGVEFDTAFVIVKEMIPKDQQAPRSTYKPKQAAAKSNLKARANAISKELES